MLQRGEMPPELAGIIGQQAAPHVDENGKPIIDAEGGAVVQPTPGFVVKTVAPNVGKVFINMCHHELVDGIEQKAVPKADAEKYGTAEQGIRIPLSMGERREENDKKGEPAMVIDVIWATATVEQALAEGAFRQSIVELAFNYI